MTNRVIRDGPAGAGTSRVVRGWVVTDKGVHADYTRALRVQAGDEGFNVELGDAEAVAIQRRPVVRHVG